MLAFPFNPSIISQSLVLDNNSGSKSSESVASYVAIEIKRRAGIDAVDQLLRYMEYLNADPYLPGGVRGIVVALTVAPQAKKYAWSKGIKTVEVDYDELRGIRPTDLRLF